MDRPAETLPSPPRWRLNRILPEGRPLPDEDWQRRHRVISGIAVVHVPVVFVFALLTGVGLIHALVETSPVALAALVGINGGPSRRLRELGATFALVSASAVLVHLSGGLIEMHFHFFVVVAMVTLYQQWQPFLLAIAFVAVHHGVAGALEPGAVFNHPSAMAHPWRWAGIHAGFISLESAVGIANWKLNEKARERAESYFRHLYEGEHALLQRIVAVDRVKDELVSAISHEFRTPLTSILGFAAALRKTEPMASEAVGDYAQRIERQGHRLQQLVDNLLEYDRPLDAEAGTCVAADAIGEAVRVSANVQRESPVAVEIDVPADLQLPMHAHELQLLVTNLLSNALKFREPGTPVRVLAQRTTDLRIRLEVVNQGPDIPASVRAKIFDPFFQVDSSNTRSADGIGLGLHIAKRIVAGVNGSIEVDSRDGVTRFVVELPEPVTEIVTPATASVLTQAEGTALA